MTAAERTVFFKLNGDDNKISVSHILNNVSGTLKDLLNVSTDQEVVVPIEQEVEKGDIEFLNKFVEESSKIFGDDLEKHSDDLSYWMTKIVSLALFIVVILSSPKRRTNCWRSPKTSIRMS
jgi:hypothetical protein